MKLRLGLQARLDAFILAIATPVFLGAILISSLISGDALTQQTINLLETVNNDLAVSTNTWLQLNSNSLRQVALSQDIISLDPARQKPVLRALVLANPNIYLASTTNSSGFNIARSDSEALLDYTDRQWFLAARAGSPFSYQTLIGRTNGLPSLVIATPIRNEGNSIIGVVMFSTDLTVLADQINVSTIGTEGTAYIIDGQNRVVAHPDERFTRELRDFSDSEAVKLLRSGETGDINFTDKNGRKWRGYVQQLDNGWGVIVQVPTDQILAPVYRVRDIAFITIGIGFALLSLLVFLVTRRVVSPLKTLTGAATAISEGDLDRRVNIASTDEIGTLATSFNNMTDRLRTTLYDLQIGIQQRTSQLERTLLQLRSGVEITRSINTILDVPTLLSSVVNEVKDKFDLYYVGVFLMDANGEYAVLRAGTGEAGEKMMAQGHKLLRGGTSMIGWVTTRMEPRIALDVGKESVRFNNPFLPLTRSEMAVPIVSRGKILGALTIQSSKAAAFNDNDVLVMQGIADNLAVSLENANLFQQTQQNLDEIRSLNQSILREAWGETLEVQQGLTGQYSSSGQAVEIQPERASSHPLTLREQSIGQIQLDLGDHKLTPEDAEMIDTIAIQTALALENARLLEETQRNALQEQRLNEMTSLFSRAATVEDVLKTAVQELMNLPAVAEVVVQITAPATEVLEPPHPNGHKEMEQ